MRPEPNAHVIKASVLHLMNETQCLQLRHCHRAAFNFNGIRSTQSARHWQRAQREFHVNIMQVIPGIWPYSFALMKTLQRSTYTHVARELSSLVFDSFWCLRWSFATRVSRYVQNKTIPLFHAIRCVVPRWRFSLIRLLRC